jgi:uncharacterized protein
MELSFRIIRPEEYITVPWKNGRGVTTELAVGYSESGQPYLWRISIAGVTEDGPFSDFSGYDRILVMLEGKGVRLDHSDGSVNELKTTSDIALFKGELLTSARLTEGGIKDFNVMTLISKCKAEVSLIARGGKIEIKGCENFFYAKNSDAYLTIGDNELSIPEGHLLSIKPETVVCAELISGELIAVKIFYL